MRPRSFAVKPHPRSVAVPRRKVDLDVSMGVLPFEEEIGSSPMQRLRVIDDRRGTLAPTRPTTSSCARWPLGAPTVIMIW